MKLHRLLIIQLATDLVEIFQNQKHAEQVVERTLKAQRKWGSRDRRFYADNLYSCVRWWRKLWHCLGGPEPESISLEGSLRVWACHWILSGHELPDNLEILNMDVRKIRQQAEELKSSSNLLAITESIPDWMNNWGLTERGERWPAILKSLNEPAPVDLRVNTLKVSRKKLKDQLRQEEILCEDISTVSTGLTLSERKNVLMSSSFQRGFFEIQDRGSQQIAPLLPLQPGGIVIDACAGGGGKALHLATLMQNKGKIIAMDVHEWKLKSLRERALRNGIGIIETRLMTGAETLEKLNQSAQALLLDVPCSGMGVLRRHPDTKWKLSSREIERLLLLQAEILRDYSKMVKPEGFMLYATCSVMESENQQQVKKFLDSSSGRASNWKLVHEAQIDPEPNGGDGFFAALLQRS